MTRYMYMYNYTLSPTKWPSILSISDATIRHNEILFKLTQPKTATDTIPAHFPLQFWWTNLSSFPSPSGHVTRHNSSRSVHWSGPTMHNSLTKWMQISRWSNYTGSPPSPPTPIRDMIPFRVPQIDFAPAFCPALWQRALCGSSSSSISVGRRTRGGQAYGPSFPPLHSSALHQSHDYSPPTQTSCPSTPLLQSVLADTWTWICYSFYINFKFKT